MRKRILVVMAALSVAMLSTGCVKIIDKGTEGQYTGKVEFNASDNVEEMWKEAVKDISDRAVDLPTFLKEANGDLSSLVDKYGKYSMGTSGSISYPVKGTGVVEEVETSKKAGYITVKLDGYDGAEVIKMQVGSIYKGSSTRDTLTIINYGDYTNQEEWGDVSKTLHEKIDKEVIGGVDLTSIQGKTVDFVGTFTVDGNDELLITPVVLTVQ